MIATTAPKLTFSVFLFRTHLHHMLTKYDWSFGSKNMEIDVQAFLKSTYFWWIGRFLVPSFITLFLYRIFFYKTKKSLQGKVIWNFILVPDVCVVCVCKRRYNFVNMKGILERISNQTSLIARLYIKKQLEYCSLKCEL